MAGNSGKAPAEGRYAKITALGTVALVVLTYLLVAIAEHWPPFSSSAQAGGIHAPGGLPSPSAQTAGWASSWSGPVGITANGLNFDDNPPSSVSADIFFNGSLSSTDTAILATWPQSGTPTAADCANWVTTHPGSIVSTVTVGMQICLKTQQGRSVLLRILGTTSDAVQARAIIWQQR